MSDTVSPPPGTKEFTLLASLVALLLLGAAGGLAGGDAGAGRGIATVQDEGDVTITSPAENETFGHADIVRIDLEFENAETAVLTLENVTNVGPDPVTFHVTVRDADGSGNATVYFNPFQGYDGPVTDCEPDVPFEECTEFFVPDEHRNHGFFTHPDDGGTVLRHPDRPAAVRDAPGETERAGGSAGEYVTPARVAYELSASTGSEVDIDHRRYPDDATTVRLAAIEDCSMELLTAPRTGPGALDPGELQRFEDVEAAMEGDLITPPGSGRAVPSEEYVVFDIRAPGLGGIFHEAARQRGAEREAAFLDGESTLTDVFRDAVGRYDGGLDTVRLDVLSRGEGRVEIDPESSIERVVAERDRRGNLARYVVVLRLEPGTAVTRGEARLSSGMVLNSSFSASSTGRHRSSLSVVPRDSEQPLPLIACRTDELGWTFYDSTNASISAGFTSPPSAQEVGENVTFNGLRSEGIIGSYEWEFGDGTTATGRSVKHAFDEPGEYTVELTVSGPAGNDTATETVVVVRDADDPLPDADFTVDAPPQGAEPGKEVRFRAAIGSGRVDAYEWAFGDGRTATGPAVTHTYDEPGEYTVKLTVQGIAGENTTQRTVVVEEASEPSVSIRGESQEGTVVLRADVEGGAVERYGWDMGDGTTLEGANVTHTYDAPGEYTVELFVTGPGGTDTASVTVIAEEPDEAGGGDGNSDEEITVTLDEDAGGEATRDDGSGPGFGIVAALAALAGVAGFLRQRRRWQ